MIGGGRPLKRLSEPSLGALAVLISAFRKLDEEMYAFRTCL